MKKFKKSLVILPAIATMALTTVASVTGTVAWFTASRNVTVNATTFETVAENSDLTVDLTNGEGTSVNDGNYIVSVSGKLTHGSYAAQNGAAGHAYVVDWEDGATAESMKYKDLGTEASHVDSAITDTTKNNNMWLANKTKSIYYAVSWKMKFSYDSEDETNYLLFDIAGASFTDSVTNGDTIKGLRIALMTANHFIVLGGDADTTYVTSTTSIAEYESSIFFNVNQTSTAKLVDGDSTITSTKLSFGNIKTNNDVEITCVAWFEGSDANIADVVNEENVVMSKVSATLPFYVRSTAA